MRRIREVLRQRWECGLSERIVAASCSLARSTVAKYVQRAQEAGLGWPLPEGLTDEQLERRLFPVESPSEIGPHVMPDWMEVHRQLSRKGVTFRDTHAADTGPGEYTGTSANSCWSGNREAASSPGGEGRFAFRRRRQP